MAKILLLGCGAIGSNLIQNLVSDLREHDYTVMDFDIVEARNFETGIQFYMPEQKDVFKVAALRINIFVKYQKKIETISGKLLENTVSLLDGYDLYLDCFDNPEARKLVYNFCKTNSKECLHIGFSPNMTFEICWNEAYEVPEINPKIDICVMQGAKSFIEYTCGIAGNVIFDYMKNNRKRNFTGNRFSLKEII